MASGLPSTGGASGTQELRIEKTKVRLEARIVNDNVWRIDNCGRVRRCIGSPGLLCHVLTGRV